MVIFWEAAQGLGKVSLQNRRLAAMSRQDFYVAVSNGTVIRKATIFSS